MAAKRKKASWARNHMLVISCLFALAWVTLFYAAVRYEWTETLIWMWMGL